MATMTHREFAQMGGEARAKKLTPEQRQAIARKGGLARWAGHKKHYGTKKR